MGKIDFDAINREALARYPALLEEWLPGGATKGHEFLSRNPNRSDNKPGSFSININTGKWGDFSSGDTGGDPVSLYAYLRHNGEQGPAAKELAERLGMDRPNYKPTPKPSKPKAKKPTWAALPLVPEDAGEPPGHYEHGTPDQRWAYRDAAGNLIGYVCRFDKPDGGKEVIPAVYARSDAGRQEWRWLSFSKPRPMYGLDRLAARPKANVVVVEGEKCADALQALIPELVVVSWPGGGKAVKHADFSALHGRKVVCWPDNDEPGTAAMLEIAQDLGESCEGLRILRRPEGKPKGWDVADAIAEGWSRADVLKFMKENILDPAELVDSAELVDPAEPTEEEPPPPEEPPGPEEYPDPDSGGEQAADYYDDDWVRTAPFRLLGYNNGEYFYMPKGTGQVTAIRGASHNKAALMTLAQLQWWERTFPGKDGAAWAIASNAIMRQNEQRGLFNPDRIRSRGVWEDKGRSVLHMGDVLYVDGARTAIFDLDSAYTYPVSPSLDRNFTGSPLPKTEAHKFEELCNRLTWRHPIYGRLLAGWCVIAPICGGLRWRPHIWITGSHASGKSTVMGEIVQPALGQDFALSVQSSTTEAGVRQALGHDARPVIFDEIESNDPRAQQRVQSILELVRQASSESGAAILKGTKDGRAIAFKIRSCFVFSSINVSIREAADHSRITVLQLVADRSQDRDTKYQAFKQDLVRTLSPEFCASLRARSVRLLPTIKKNAEVFARAGSICLGSQRIGDQIGTILAGSFSLHSEGEVTIEQAMKYLEREDWSAIMDLEQVGDHQLCLDKILESMIRIEGEKMTHTVSVGEAVRMATSKEKPHEDITRLQAEDTLKRNGVLIDLPRDGVVIAKPHSAIKKLLEDTPWVDSYDKVLERIDGAYMTKNPKAFTDGVRKRGVNIPLVQIVDGWTGALELLAE